MKEIEIENKEQYLKENYPFNDVPGLADRIKCIHCDNEFEVIQYRVFRDRSGNEYICCPDSDCDGTIIDWIRL